MHSSMMPLLKANLKMMVRDRQTIFWALAFPLIFVVIFGLFDLEGGSLAKIAVFDQANTPVSQQVVQQVKELSFLETSSEYTELEDARKAVENGDIQYVLSIPQSFSLLDLASQGNAPVSITIYYDQANVRSNQLVIGTIRQFLDQFNLALIGKPRLIDVAAEPVRARQVSYFDVLLMGLIGMGVMIHSVMGIAAKISGYRNQNILKRILATPLPVRNYFASEVIAHLILAMVQVAIIMAAGVFIFGARIYGNLLWIFLIVLLGNFIFLNLGFIVSAWAKNPAAASGLGNIITMPMMFFSGTFFPTDSLPSFLPQLVKILPMTPMLEAMRHVSIDGWQIWQTWPQLAILGGWLVVSSIAAVKFFRFQ